MDELALCQDPSMSNPIAGSGATPDQRSTWAIEEAQSSLKQLLVWGIVISIVGGVIAGSAFSADSSFAVFLGAVVAWVGSALLLVSLIGYGVKVGREAANV